MLYRDNQNDLREHTFFSIFSKQIEKSLEKCQILRFILLINQNYILHIILYIYFYIKLFGILYKIIFLFNFNIHRIKKTL